MLNLLKIANTAQNSYLTIPKVANCPFCIINLTEIKGCRLGMYIGCNHHNLLSND
jgi:hypothetical protein